MASAMRNPAVGRHSNVGRAAPHRLLILGTDAADMISGAGGLICDSVRTGLHVDVYLKTIEAQTALQILGVSAQTLPAEFDLAADWPDAIVFAAALHEKHCGVRRLITDAVRGRRADLALWGGTWPTELDAGVEVEHRLSAAARAFKLHAMKAVAANSQTAPTEPFHAAKSRIAEPAMPVLAR